MMRSGFSRRRRKTMVLSRRRIKQLIALAAALGLFGGGNAVLDGRVIRVSDGDTVTIWSSGSTERIRLYGIDCPELEQEGGRAARDFAGSLCLLSSVTVEPVDKDRYGRTVGNVRLSDGRMLNEELLKSGHAWVYDSFCKKARCRDWRKLEKEARANAHGLWAGKNPEAPWAWRKRHSR